MPKLFQIGMANSEMLARLSEKFEIHPIHKMGDPAKWLAQNGFDITYILTDEKEGVDPNFMLALPNLKAISCYGANYDSIDAIDAAARGIVVTYTPASSDTEHSMESLAVENLLAHLENATVLTPVPECQSMTSY